MHSRRESPVRHRLITTLAMILVSCVGCDDRNSRIRSYTVPKEQVRPVAETPVSPPPTALPAGTMQWAVPDGWASTANTNAMRFATLIAGDDPDSIEVAITRLGGAAGGAGANINRWRGQVGLPPADEQELLSITRAVMGRRGAPGLMVDLVGPGDAAEGQPPRMLATIFPTETDTWFIKTMGPRDLIERHVDGFIMLCESVTFESQTASAPSAPPRAAAGPGSATGNAPAWTSLPEGWAADAQPRPMSVASFTISGGGQEASLTITPLGGSQDLRGNINRWRGQVGLPPVETPDAVPFEVAGLPGTLVDLAGTDLHTLGVISRRGDRTWFYKLTGPDPLVADQRAAFEGFVRSIHFETGPS